MTETEQPSRLKKFWRDRVLAVIVAQFTQGVTPEKITLTIALGCVLGIFPILGATSLLCGIVGVAMKLNQPVIQLVNWIASPLQLTLIVVFARIGEWIMRAQRVSFSVPEMLHKFHESPAHFMQEFGMTGVHAIVAWFLIAPFVAALIYFSLLTPLRKLSQLTHAK